VAHNTIGSAAEEHVFDAAVSMCCHHNHVHAPLLGFTQNLLVRISRSDNPRRLNAVANLASNKGLELVSSLLPQLILNTREDNLPETEVCRIHGWFHDVDQVQSCPKSFRDREGALERILRMCGKIYGDKN